MGDINSMTYDLTMFHMMKTKYIYDKPDHKKWWIVDLTIYSIDKDESDNDTNQSTSKMRVRSHIMTTQITLPK
jgi:hypothetical protein